MQVEWVDSKTHRGWQPGCEMPHSVARVSSLGYVVQCNEEGVVISTSVSSEGMSLDNIIIPWGCVQSLEELGGNWDAYEQEEKVGCGRH